MAETVTTFRWSNSRIRVSLENAETWNSLSASPLHFDPEKCSCLSCFLPGFLGHVNGPNKFILEILEPAQLAMGIWTTRTRMPTCQSLECTTRWRKVIFASKSQRTSHKTGSQTFQQALMKGFETTNFWVSHRIGSLQVLLGLEGPEGIRVAGLVSRGIHPLQ